ncbi:MAG: RNA 2',3'-cyclic phosphodiesterase [Rhodospirillaceae bacterium]
MIRLFVALSLPDDLRVRLVGLAAGIEGARWVAPENLHLTLRYIGDVQEDRGEDIVAALDGVRAAPLTVTLAGTGHFDTGARAHSAWVGVEKTPEIVALHEKLDRALVRVGFEPEGRKYTPHVTLARFRRPRSGHLRDWLEANAPFAAPPFEARAFTLYESRQGDYLPLAEFPLT